MTLSDYDPRQVKAGVTMTVPRTPARVRSDQHRRTSTRVGVYRLAEGRHAGRWLARWRDISTVCDSHPQAMAAAAVLVQIEQGRRAESALRDYATACGYVGPDVPALALLPSAAGLDRARLDTTGGPT